MDIRFWAATDTGKSREHNEDNFLVDKRLNLFVVCDGMGGHAAGEVASAIAVRAVREVIANNRDIVSKQADNANTPKWRKETLKLLEYAIQEAGTRIFDMAQSNPERRGMGTTCSLMLCVGRRAFIAHVGDSRIYLLRKGQVHQLTEDHSLVNEMKRRGNGEGVEFASNYKNAITRAVGVYESVEVDTLDFDILPGDRLLLCSDGLSMYLEDENNTKIVDFLGNKGEPGDSEELRRVAEAFIQYANAQGGKDNITAVVVEAGEEEGDVETEDIRLTIETIRNIPLFHYLNYKELVRIINVTEKIVVQRGEYLVREGEDGEELFIILRGEFAVERAGVQVATLGSGRHFGEMALIDDGLRSASVRAIEDGTLLSVSRPEFYELLRRDPTMAVKLLWNFIQTLSARLRDASAKNVASPRANTLASQMQAVRSMAQAVAMGEDNTDPKLATAGSMPSMGSDPTLSSFDLSEVESVLGAPMASATTEPPGGSALRRPKLDEE